MRKFTAKISALGCALACVAPMLAGCSVVTSTTPPNVDVSADELTAIMEKYDKQGYTYEYDGGPIELSMHHWDSSGTNVERGVVNAVLQGFNKRYPDIKVNLEIIQSYEEVYGNFIGGGTAADVFLVPDGAISKWASSGVLQNLDPYIESSTLLDSMDDVYPSCLTRYQYDAANRTMGSGNQLALPKDVGPYVMFYNKDWFDKSGVDYPASDRIMTIDEATEMWKALTKKDKNGKITGYGLAGLCIEGLVWSAGGDFLTPDRKSFPTSETALAGLEKGYEYMQKSYVEYNIQPPASFSGTFSASNLFSQQKVATVITGRWDVATFRTLSFNWDVAYVPAFPENIDANMYSGSVGYAVNSKKSDATKYAAWKLVEYIASKEGQEILSSTGFQIPVYESVAMSEDFVEAEKTKGPQNYEVFVQSAKKQGYGLWQYRSSITWKTNIYDTPSEFLFAENESDRKTVKQFLEEAKAKAASELG